MRKQKPDLATLLALYQQLSPEKETQHQLDQAKLAEILQSQQYAQQLGYPSMTAMNMHQRNEDRDAQRALYEESRKQSAISSKLQNVSLARPDVIPELLAQMYPDLPPPPQPRKKK